MHNARSGTVATIDIGELPSVPHVLLKLIDTCHDVDATFDELTQIIRQDTALCAKIITVANTPTYAQWNGIEDFNRLVIILGLEPIKAISITAVVQQFFSQFDQNLGECMGVLWSESLTCAHTAKKLAALTGYPSIDEAYLTGLLHNLGKLAILKLQPKRYADQILGTMSHQDQSKLEIGLAGAESAAIGARLLEETTKDSFIGDAIYFQNADPERILDSSHLIKLINLSQKLTHHGFHADEAAEAAFKLFGLNQAVLDDISAPITDAVRDTAQTYGIELGQKKPVNLDNQDIRIQLAKRVKGFALLHGTAKATSDDEHKTTAWEDIARNLKILFRLNHLVIFTPSSDGSLLQSMAIFNAARAPEPLTIPIQSDQSSITIAAKKCRPQLDLELGEHVQASVLDHQLRRLLSSEALIAIPLYSKNTLHGVIAAGFSLDQKDFLKQSLDLIAQYSFAAAKTIHTIPKESNQDEPDLEAENSRQISQTRRLAHEANNPIGVIKNYLHVLSIKLGDESEVTEHLDTLTSEIDRVADIIARMRDVYDPQGESQSPTTNSTCDVNQVIQRLISLYSSSLFVTHNITSRMNLDDSIGDIDIKQSSLQQVLTNLIKNATEAMPTGGCIEITTQNQPKLNAIELKISDNGPGIPSSIMEKIFSPVQSTKGASHSGLGLSIVNNLVQDMGGKIKAQNLNEGGSEFILHLPCTVNNTN